MVTAWSEHAARYLLATTLCPRCDADLGGSSVCSSCDADLGGPAGERVWEASRRAADAVLERQRLIEAVPTVSATASPAAAVPTTPGATAAGATSVVAPASVTGPRADAPQPGASQVSVQSVLAVAGAGLFAIAAIVFAFLNPDVGFAVRTMVIAVVTAVFLAGAWLLRRRGVRFSSEAIGALGMVFLALDVWAFSESAPESVNAWVFAAIGTLAASLLTLAVAWLVRIRTWLWTALVGLALVPAFLGYASGGWGAAWWHVGVIAVVLGAQELLRWARPRFDSRLGVDRVTLSVLQGVATVAVLLQLPFLWAESATVAVLGRVALLVALAVGAGLTARHAAPRMWSYTAGALAAVALALLPLAVERIEPDWLLALVPLGAAIVLAASGFVGADWFVRARPVQAGALTVALAAAVPSLVVALIDVTSIATAFTAAVLPRSGGGAIGGIRADGTVGAFTDTAGLAAVLGLAAFALGTGLLAVASRPASAPTGGFPAGVVSVGAFYGVLAGMAFIGWTGLAPIAQASVGIAVALLACGAARLPSWQAARAHRVVRTPLVVLAHASLVEVALITWIEPAITVPVGVVLVAAVLVVARTTPAGVRAIYIGVAYAYALVLFATALDRVGVATIAVLCLTTTLASLSALGATIVRRVDARSWYAILVVTAVPFVIGVASVLGERSGWTALSTGVTFLLALALVLTRRPGLNRVVRSAAAALLVPSLAVVVVCLGAEFLEVSGSPVVLPVIAAIVAVALPSTKAVETALARRGLDTGDAAAVRLWIEISSLVTAAIAVLLALVREAAGLGTAVTVLVLIGFGAAATRILAGRRYGWWLAGASWTGALWCVWAMLGVDVVEPYTLPPSLAAVTIASILVARTGRGVALFTIALAGALVPSLAMLAAWGDGDAAFAWRTWALLAASVVLLGLGWALTRQVDAVSRTDGARLLRVPLLAGALVAASAGSIQAVRYGLERDPIALADPDLVMFPALALSFGAGVLAAASAGLLWSGARRATERSKVERWLVRTRWLFAPALVLLVAGPISAIRHDWFAIWTLWILMALLLGLALVTVARAWSVRPVLPPFWFTYALAWATGVTGWSMRDLRVEVFSLPLGLAVLVAGVIAMRPGSRPTRATLDAWPIGFTGSWRLLAPGIVLTVLPSILATGTDPQLYRPILVIGLALAAILVGSARRLAAPFILGLAILPVENIVVFAAQIDRTVGAMPWWITLATAGSVLLAIAVGSERRTNRGIGVAARLRELE